MYIYHNRQTDALEAFGNLRALSNNTLIPYDRLVYQFGRKKRLRYERPNEFQIIKTKLITK